VWAPRDERLEQQLYKSAHVSSGINFSKYDDIPVEASGNEVPEIITTFEQATLDPLLVENIDLAGYKTPTPVQKYSIPVVGAQRDLMACAQTGM
jgi:ATP-dependent RNA helicase DDX3X